MLLDNILFHLIYHEELGRQEEEEEYGDAEMLGIDNDTMHVEDISENDHHKNSNNKGGAVLFETGVGEFVLNPHSTIKQTNVSAMMGVFTNLLFVACFGYLSYVKIRS